MGFQSARTYVENYQHQHQKKPQIDINKVYDKDYIVVSKSSTKNKGHSRQKEMQFFGSS